MNTTPHNIFALWGLDLSEAVVDLSEAAVDLSDVPDAADGDFSEVAFYNMVCFVGCGIGCSTICWMCGTVCLLYVIMISLSVTLSFTIVAWPKHLAHLPSFLHLHP